MNIEFVETPESKPILVGDLPQGTFFEDMDGDIAMITTDMKGGAGVDCVIVHSSLPGKQVKVPFRWAYRQTDTVRRVFNDEIKLTQRKQ